VTTGSSTLLDGNGLALAVDADKLYYLVPSDCVNEECSANGMIGSVSKQGGAGTTVASSLIVSDSVLFVNGGFAYFNMVGKDADEPAGIGRVPTSGGELTTFAEGARASKMVFDGAYAYWLGATNNGVQALIRESLAGGQAETVVPLPSLTEDLGHGTHNLKVDLVMDDTAFIWSDGSGNINVLAK
jgi:hypothetical protein